MSRVIPALRPCVLRFVRLTLLALMAHALLALAAAAHAQGAQAAQGLTESLLNVGLSRGGELPVLVSTRTGTRPTIAVLLFPGAPGIMRLREEGGTIRYGLVGNFLIRARRWLNTDDIFTVSVDCPVDQWTDCGDRYRSSAQHAADILDVVNAVKARHAAQKVYLAGTSYGTVSTAFLARALQGQIDGAVHTATFTDAGKGRNAHGAMMAGFDWAATTTPQLFVHHRDDPCYRTRHAGIMARRGPIPLITVQGQTDPRGDECEAFTAHGFVGRERVVMAAIAEWITVRRTPAMVGGEP